MVREFKLINEKGQEYSLMNIYGYCLFTDPSGLGYTYETEYERVGNTFIDTLRRLQQGQISGTLNFFSYDNFLRFSNFVENSEKLKFSYKIPFQAGSKEFFKDVKIQSVSKTEKQTTGIITEPVVFDCLSLWYEELENVYTIDGGKNEIRWNFRWDSKFADYTIRNLEYVNKGHIEAPIYVEFEGPVTNPSIILFIEGQEVQKLEIPIILQEYEKLIYNTKENEFCVKKINTDGTEENLFSLDYIDPKNNNVIRLPKGKSCKLQISAESNIKGKVRILTYYKIV